jgi:hypothetical protein
MPAQNHCAVGRPLLAFSEMGMGSPDNRREADDSCQAPCVGRSVSNSSTVAIGLAALLKRVARQAFYHPPVWSHWPRSRANSGGVRQCCIGSAQHAADTVARDKRTDLCCARQRAGRHSALFPFRVSGQKSRRDVSVGHAFGQRQRRASDRGVRRVGSGQRIAICLVESVAVRGDGVFGLLHDRLFLQFANPRAGKRRREKPRYGLCCGLGGVIDWSGCCGICDGQPAKMSFGRWQ